MPRLAAKFAPTSVALRRSASLSNRGVPVGAQRRAAEAGGRGVLAAVGGGGGVCNATGDSIAQQMRPEHGSARQRAPAASRCNYHTVYSVQSTALSCMPGVWLA